MSGSSPLAATLAQYPKVMPEDPEADTALYPGPAMVETVIQAKASPQDTDPLSIPVRRR
jgi:hypothetical protein